MPVFVNWLTWPGALHLPPPCWNCLLILIMMCSIVLSNVLNFSFHQWQVGKHSSVFVMEVLASAPFFSHATAAYIALASISLSGAFPPTTEFTHLQTAIAMFNQQVTEGEALTTVSVLLSPPRQHLLSEKVEKLALSSLLHNATTATKAQLLAESVPQAHAWLRTVPSPSLGLALEPDETHILLNGGWAFPSVIRKKHAPIVLASLTPWDTIL